MATDAAASTGTATTTDEVVTFPNSPRGILVRNTGSGSVDLLVNIPAIHQDETTFAAITDGAERPFYCPAGITVMTLKSASSTTYLYDSNISQ